MAKLLQWKNEHLKKVIDPKHLLTKVEEIRKDGKTIATINGSFDLLHPGHLHILFEASQTADILIVALNSDTSIKQYKDPSRPILHLEERLQMVTALQCVDYVTWFDETDPRRILELIRPNIHNNGASYGTNCIEAETVLAHGGEIHLISFIDGCSTSDLINRCQQLKTE